MTIFGNICVGLLGLVAFLMFRFVSESVSRYDYIAAILFSLLLLVALFTVFATITAIGKLDFLGWPRLLQYAGVSVACLSLTVLTGMAAAVHGSGGQEFPWSIRPFCPWAAYTLPFVMAVIGALWLNSGRLALSEHPLRVAFGIIIAIALLSNITLGVEIGRSLQQKAEEHAGDAAPLAEPARGAILLSAERLRGESGTGRPLEADDVQSGVDSVLTVADKFSRYGVDFLPAVRDYRAALNDAPKSAKVPPSSVKKMDAWLAAKPK